ncbi:uncharacterized protein SCODWIG_01051 [Saccharomycodes ludwigii]|uniref:Nucleoporin POM33 n=1 Tax=Saccharomycodes ludwigii TaxID=36035 RepID=A0A376B579_9ASCO|nr:hypothetical protein SCDLUD_000629 [Saccharomycodes ludwigii]KAH3903024.1 hypothetical protein SCDLUD_000629 [Saccharomycodes ludwigii]SSD59290.1 uncharacterized protein SCODWIG_01051 [Saccharomycodes ludwigii]
MTEYNNNSNFKQSIDNHTSSASVDNFITSSTVLSNQQENEESDMRKSVDSVRHRSNSNANKNKTTGKSHPYAKLPVRSTVVDDDHIIWKTKRSNHEEDETTKKIKHLSSSSLKRNPSTASNSSTKRKSMLPSIDFSDNANTSLGNLKSQQPLHNGPTPISKPVPSATSTAATSTAKPATSTAATPAAKPITSTAATSTAKPATSTAATPAAEPAGGAVPNTNSLSNKNKQQNNETVLPSSTNSESNTTTTAKEEKKNEKLAFFDEPAAHGKHKEIRKIDNTFAKTLHKKYKLWELGHIVMLTFGCLYSVFYFYHSATFYRYRSWKTLFLLTKKQIRSDNGYGWLNWKFWIITLLFKHILFNPYVWYHIACLGSLLAHYISLDQATKSSFFYLSYYDLITMDNFQNMCVLLLWFFTRPSFYKILPNMMLSYFHLFEAKKPKLSKVGDTLLKSFAYTDYFIMFILILETILFKGTAGFVLTIYFMIFWLKLNFTGYTQYATLSLLAKFDHKVPPKYQDQWKNIKKFFLLKLDEKYKQRELYMKKTR